jgi:small subunit ribosomal protein S20
VPHTKQTVKRVKTNEIRRQRNLARRSRLRHAVRDLRTAIAKADGPSEALSSQLKSCCSLLDRMASKGVLHRNQAARLKSRLTSQTPGSS